LHWLGDLLAIGLFAVWCGWTQRQPGAAWSV
jgi:hypothetical protein